MIDLVIPSLCEHSFRNGLYSHDFFMFTEGPDALFNFSCNVACVQQDFLGVSPMQFVARTFAKVELDSTSATLARNVAKKVAPCVRVFILQPGHQGSIECSTAVKRSRRFSFYLVGLKSKHGQGCIKQLVNITIFKFFQNNELFFVEN